MATKEFRELAESTWVIALDVARAKGTAYRRKGRDGFRVIVKGGIKGLIVKAASDLGRDKPPQTMVIDVREFLRRAENVVYLGSGGSRHTSEIFVAKDWSEKMGDAEQTIIRKAFNPRDTGQQPGGESGDVEVSNFFDEFVDNPLGAVSVEVVANLAKAGGKVTYKQIYSKKWPHNAGQIQPLLDRGLVQTKMANARRYECIKLTPKGWMAAHNLDLIQTNDIAVESFLRRNGGSFEKAPEHSSVSLTLAPLLHRTYANVGNGIRKLEKTGVIVVDRGEPGEVNDGYPKAITLKEYVQEEGPVDLSDPGPRGEEKMREPKEAPVPKEQIEEPLFDPTIEDAIRVSNDLGRILDHLNDPSLADGRIDDICKVVKGVEDGEYTLIQAFTQISRIVS